MGDQKPWEKYAAQQQAQPDWFEQNAPKPEQKPWEKYAAQQQSKGDWFEQNAPPKLSSQQFAAKIRAKYPGAYDNVADDELTRRVIAKYPVYADQVNVPAQLGTTPESLGVTPGLPGSKPKALQGKPTMADKIRAGEDDLPGSFEGKPENTGQYISNGPGEMAAGAKDILSGRVAKGTHRVISGAGTTALPVAALTAPAAPVATLKGVVAGAVGSTAAHKGAEALGATPDQADAIGDIAGVLSGAAAPKLGQAVRSGYSRALLLGKTPKGAYESALKPSTTLSQAEREAVVNTGLSEGIPVSKSGAEKLASLIDDVNNEIKATVAQNPNAPINKFKVTPKLNDTVDRFSNQVAPTSDLEAISRVGEDFVATHPATIPAAKAQAIKQGTYARIGDRAYGEVGSATTEAEKALARGLKDEIAAQFPEIKALNARDSKLLDLQPVLERAVARTGNHQLIGIGTPIASGAAKAVTGSRKVAAVAGVVKGVLDNPAVKSRLAIMLIHSGATPSAASQRIDAYAATLGQLSAHSQTDDK